MRMENGLIRMDQLRHSYIKAYINSKKKQTKYEYYGRVRVKKQG